MEKENEKEILKNLLQEFIHKETDINAVCEVLENVRDYLHCQRHLKWSQTDEYTQSLPGRDGIVDYHRKQLDRAAHDLEKSLIDHSIESIGLCDLDK